MAIEIQAKNPTIQMGTQGPRGERGPKGDPFTYDDFTPEQLESLKGPKGDPFTYDDFTPEELESLKGPKGDPFTYDDFTAEQLELLRGPKGPKGDAFTYNDFTPEQLAQLKGPKGDSFTYDDFTPEQLESLKGSKGDPFTYNDFTAEQLEQLKGPKGPKGDSFTYEDFTPEQLAQLKGQKGDPFTYNDFTPEQLEQLKGPKGDAFTYDDFTPEQLEQLKGPKGDTGAPGPTYTAGTNITISADNVISATGSGGGGSIPKPLTYDYMPEGYPSKSVQTTTLMEEQQVAFTLDSPTYFALLTNPFEISVGQTYTVNWDGTEYECVCFASTYNVYRFGNISILGGGGDTGEPFLYTYKTSKQEGYFDTLDTSASHTISVKTTEEIVTPMAEEFLPTNTKNTTIFYFK